MHPLGLLSSQWSQSRVVAVLRETLEFTLLLLGQLLPWGEGLQTTLSNDTSWPPKPAPLPQRLEVLRWAARAILFLQRHLWNLWNLMDVPHVGALQIVARVSSGASQVQVPLRLEHKRRLLQCRRSPPPLGLCNRLPAWCLKHTRSWSSTLSMAMPASSTVVRPKGEQRSRGCSTSNNQPPTTSPTSGRTSSVPTPKNPHRQATPPFITEALYRDRGDHSHHPEARDPQ